jgi:hypothetical protein
MNENKQVVEVSSETGLQESARQAWSSPTLNRLSLNAAASTMSTIGSDGTAYS